ncbi:FkbM family methyltransferase [Actinomadura sp. NAK00032]|uniref:FkbM family methyltransferase n=1 Tax=Actinomadura sp. NAK00032 TaxID=2742128 RepID=UPI0015907E94|nr:FkbM family methyltransferase [Actinomadura sp. NAK00032]QKW36964.1 FkbM family methyltransferase [Actinomadura sp. NAK00032]
MSDATENFSSFITVNGAKLFLDSTDGRAAALLRRRDLLHPTATALWQLAINSASWDWVIDVGANYGEMLVGTDLPSGSTVVAVEPNQRVLPYLARSLQDAIPTATILPCAVSDVCGTATMHEDLTWSGNSTLEGEWVAERADHTWRRIDVPALTLPKLLTEIGVRRDDAVLIKLDIEGHEGTVMRTALGSLRDLSRCAVMVELVRLCEADLSWLLTEFCVTVLDVHRSVLVSADGMSVAELSSLIEEGDVHQRDVLAVPRRDRTSRC